MNLLKLQHCQRPYRFLIKLRHCQTPYEFTKTQVLPVRHLIILLLFRHSLSDIILNYCITSTDVYRIELENLTNLLLYVRYLWNYCLDLIAADIARRTCHYSIMHCPLNDRIYIPLSRGLAIQLQRGVTPFPSYCLHCPAESLPCFANPLLIYHPAHKTSVDSMIIMKWTLGPMSVDEVAPESESAKGVKSFVLP